MLKITSLKVLFSHKYFGVGLNVNSCKQLFTSELLKNNNILQQRFYRTIHSPNHPKRLKKSNVNDDSIFSVISISLQNEKDKDNIIEGKRKNIIFTLKVDEIDNEEEEIELNKQEKLRLDKLLSTKLNISREYSMFLLQNGYVKLNGKTLTEAQTHVKLSLLDEEPVFEVFLENRPSSTTKNEILQVKTSELTPPVNVLYEDKDLLVVNKPSNFAVHSSKTHPEETTMIFAVRHYVFSKAEEEEKKQKKKQKKKKEEELPLVVNLVHRIEVPLSGALLVGKNSYTTQKLSEQFNRSLEENVDNKSEKARIQFCAVCAITDLPGLKRKLNTMHHFREEYEEDMAENNEWIDLSDDTMGDEYLDEGLEEDDFFEDAYEIIEEDEVIDIDQFKEREEDFREVKNYPFIDLKKEHEKLKALYEKGLNNTLLTFEGDVKIVKHNSLKISEMADTHDDKLNYKIVKNAKTTCNILEINEEARIAFVTVNVPSGSSQQIRPHLANNGIPILGDLLYYDQVSSGSRIPYALSRDLGISQPLLHHYKVNFKHPVSNQHLIVKAPLIGNMKVFIEKYFSKKIVDKYCNLKTNEEDENNEEEIEF
ncbi:hypothetical protein ABK040_006562 [Willaertia magna]